ncbi:thermonuclease family protein [Alkalilacustris brevis]|uniref:thermonuclease family protein n=1 Tax=Alkalilacustris brevis TaxID=2026338 RepID=UPI00139053FD|nr:thermonuclease family protein [Alkalilacustris brevis]
MPGAHPAGAEILRGPAHVIDGDTIDLGATRIRIHGIDAPERAERCAKANGADWACGLWAQYETERRYQGEVLECRDLGERTHGRVVAQCFHQGRDIALDLIAAGVVQACPRYALEHPHSLSYIDAEKEAAFAAAGIFAGPVNPRAGFCAERAAPSPAPFLPATSVQPREGDCVIKGNVSAGGRIYHVPGQRDYDRVNMNAPGKRWFCSEEEARAAGWRPARR